RRLLRTPNRSGGFRRLRRRPRSDVPRRQPAGGVRVPRQMNGSHGTAPHLTSAIVRVLDMSLGQMLWSQRTLFLGVLAGAPVALSLLIRLAALTNATFIVNGRRPAGSEVFGAIVWLVFIRFIVPVVGVFYGTALIADEVDDKTITYLFTR